jgi:hypothetical protein
VAEEQQVVPTLQQMEPVPPAGGHSWSALSQQVLFPAQMPEQQLSIYG